MLAADTNKTSMGIINEAIDQWIDELPLDELDCSSKYIIKDHREGFTTRKHTVAALYKHCSDEIAQWIINNEDFSRIIR